MSPRIQRMMMKLQRYDFELIYTPGTYIVLAVALSRAPLPSMGVQATPTSEDIDVHVNMVTSSLPVSDVMLQKIVQETAKNVTLQRVMTNLQDGRTKGNSPQFYPVRAELSPLYPQANGKTEKGVQRKRCGEN